MVIQNFEILCLSLRFLQAIREKIRVQLGYNVMEGNLCSYERVLIIEEYNVMVNSEQIIDKTEYLTLYTMCSINQCRYNRVRLYILCRLF
jgi:hypothetical protein